MKYPEILVLEMGADRPGDIQYLTSFIKPNVGVITNISESHLEFFGNLEGVLEEKIFLVKNMQENGLAVLNVDNEYLAKLKGHLKMRTLGFGFSEKAEMRAEGVNYNYENEKFSGLSFKLGYKGTNLPVRLKNILAKHQICAALAGAAVGAELGMNLVEIADALRDFSSLPGRMNIFPGIKNSLIIEDSYNASPISTEAALDVAGDLKTRRKVVVLGDMLELGKDTEAGHRKIAKKFMEIGGNIFIGVGSRMSFAVEELIKNNFPKENVFHFKNSPEAAEFAPKILQEGDLVLVKGSQGARMEKVSEVLAENYQEAAKFIPRQDREWRKKPVKNV